MTALHALVDKLFNWSGGAYVGLATLTIIGLAVAQYAAGTPMVVAMPDGKPVVYIVHQAPEWFVGTIGLYTVILALFWAGKPINTWVNSKALPPDSSAPKAGQVGSVRLSAVLFLLISLAILCTAALAETREEMRARLEEISATAAQDTDGKYAAEIDALRKRLNLKPLCKGGDCSKEYPWLTNKQVRKYQALEKFLTGGGTEAIAKDAARAGCFDRLKDGKKGCYAAMRPAGKDSVWECYPLSRKEAPECYEAGE